MTSKMADVTLIIIMTLIACMSLGPIWHTVAVSLSDKAYAAAGRVTFWPVGFNVSSYYVILSDSSFIQAFMVSVKRVVLGGAVNFGLCVLMAYPLSRTSREFRYRNLYMWFLVFCMLFSGGIIPLYILMKTLGLFNSIWALVLPGAVPVFNVILLMNFFRSLPKELSEAGYIDGAGPWYMAVRIFIPLSTPALATITLFSIVTHWNSFFDGLIFMRTPELYPLQTYIQQLVVQISAQNIDHTKMSLLAKLSNQTLNAAKISVSIVPILIVYPFMQKYFVHGIVLGSVKE
ncbi:ABC-type glycerol-3-phosphate transport system permease component [Paenibacillus baekrokdamisoli]|nr:ABC-type glycerol-3-phosphate transport system permease component [Paenibacillus baekrokdamisoli]